MVYGWLQADARRFKHWHLWVPRKAGKSELAAAMALRMLRADGEGLPFVCTAASSEKQARIVAAAAWHMAGRMDGLRRNRMTVRNPPAIELPDGQGTMSTLPHDIGGSLDGLSPSFAIIDEIHSYRTPATYDALAEAMGARRRAALLITSTAGDIDGIGRQQHDLARAVLDGQVAQDDLFASIHCAEPDEDWEDEAVWRRANPSIGVCVDMDYVRSRYREAKATGREGAFRRKQLNQWPKRAQTDSAWLDMSKWDACSHRLEKAPRRAWAGLASSFECAATTLLWRSGRDWRMRVRTWHDVGSAARWLARKRPVVSLCTSRTAPSIVRYLRREGCDLVSTAQTDATLAPALATLHECVAAGRVRHQSSEHVRAEMLRWSGRGNACPAPTSMLLALTVALADDDQVRMSDVPRWDRI